VSLIGRFSGVPRGLVVDDEPAIRQFVKAVLHGQNIDTLEAANAVQALQIVQRLGDQLEGLITDICMPGDFDGVDLAYSVRNSLSALTVILISGYLDKAPACFRLIQKPFRPEAILDAINTTARAQRNLAD